MSPHLLLLSVLTGIWSGPLHAEAPDTALAPVKLVVPAAPGSLTDPVARVVSQGMSRKDGRRWVVENHPGAGGAIAFRAIANAKTDGSVLMLTANNFAILPALDKNKTPSFAREFSVIGMVGRSENLLVASPASRTRDIDELIAKSKGNASPLTYTSPLPGSAAHLTMELLRRSVQINLVHVPYTNPSLGVANTVAGIIDLNMIGIRTAIPLVRTGKLVPLAWTGHQRSPELPDVPTFAEAGIKDASLSVWFALVGPARIPAGKIAHLNAQLQAVLSEPDVLSQLAALFVDPWPGKPEEAAATVAGDFSIYRNLATILALRLH